MTDNINEGIYIAGVGMGLVFLTLVVFMIILLVLNKIFPGEEIADEVDSKSSNDVGLAEADNEMDMNHTGPLDEGLGSKIAAMVVGLYLTMEEDKVVTITDASNEVAASVWNKDSQNSFWNSQGSRPTAYGSRTYKPYDPKGIGGS
ncbi:OadG family protein [Dehalococcoidia bacterium]|nr:OadG family protein [Dehalococcoidia bacterium]|tara:strand:- start:4 stop:441 length:438 start_codon:yes stop_codon:yes gene_type:complete